MDLPVFTMGSIHGYVPIILGFYRVIHSLYMTIHRVIHNWLKEQYLFCLSFVGFLFDCGIVISLA